MADFAMPESGLADTRVIVTGGSRGIGRAIVEIFAAAGAQVTFFYRDNAEAAAEVVAAQRAAGHTVHAEQVDVRDAAATEAAIGRVGERGERIDVLINNAGITRDNLLGLLTDDELASVLATNVGGVFNVTRAVVPFMIHQRAGVIINISSVAASKGGRGQSNYAASKGALEAFTRALAVELAPRGIRVNAIAPGVIDTEMSRDIVERAADAVTSHILLRRLGTPQEVAHAAWFLASRYATYITGEVLHVDGGFKM